MGWMDGWPGELSCQNKGKERERLYTRELQAILVVAYFQHRLGMPSPGLTRTRSTLVFLARARRRRRFRSLALSCLCLLPVNQLITCRLLACVGTSLSMCRSWAKTSAFSHIFSHHHHFFFVPVLLHRADPARVGGLFPTGADLARSGSASHVTTSWIFFLICIFFSTDTRKRKEKKRYLCATSYGEQHRHGRKSPLGNGPLP